ncbi:MAG: InlB B-repeat-containing protein [Bacteroidales bacterium]|nr:InlB B-repeat-containing protein [Bacteroidales bacterium]
MTFKRSEVPMCTRLMHTPKMGGGTRAKGTLFGNDFFLDVTGGSVSTGKGSIDISVSDTYSAINGADVDYLSAKYSTYGSQLNSLRLKNAQDVIALKPVAGSVIYLFGQGNNKTGAEARIPKFATDAALSSALNATPGADHPASGTYVYKFEVPEDFDGEKVLYIGSYNGDAFFSYIIVELPPVESLYEVTVSASPVEGGLVSAVQEPQQDGVTEVVTLYANPNKGYAFKEWQDAEGNTLSTTTPYTDSIKADAAYVAVFESTALPVSATPATVLVKHVYDVTGCVTKGDNQLIDSSHDGDYIKFDVIPAVAGKYSFTSMIGTKNDGMGVTLGYVDAGGNYVESEKKDITNSGNWNSGENYTWEFDLEEPGKLYTFKMLCHANGSYCVNVFEMAVVRVGDVTPTYTVTYGLGETGAVGAAPAAESLKSGKTITIPANFTLYKEGYTLTGWTDGVNTYDLGDKMTVTSNVSLTPVFTQNNVSLATRNDAVTITWDFQRKNGAPTVAWQGGSCENMAWVSQVKVNGETIDVKMGVNAASGKVANANWEDWAQLNGGTVLSIPAYKGATIQLESYSATTTTTIAGDVIDQGTKTPSYTYEGTEEQIDIVIGDGSYWRTVTLTLPARTLEVVDREDLVAEGTYAQATYSRTVDPAYNYGTICLPFTPDAETCEQYTFYTLSAATNNTITFVEVAEPQANMPYLYSAKDREATTHTFTGGETTVNTEAGAQVVGNWSFAGVFAKTVFKPAELNANLYIYKPTSGEDLIVEALNSLTMWPYRAYFKCNQVVAASAPTLRVVIDGGVTGIEEVITPDQIEGAVIYDLMGRPVQQMIEGNFYIVNGEKVLY